MNKRCLQKGVRAEKKEGRKYEERMWSKRGMPGGAHWEGRT
jgi:hypothetical protein